MAKTLDCLCVGIVVADMVCHPIEEMPRAGALTKTESIQFSIGGCSANLGVDLARLGLNVGLSGRVGSDLFGREVCRLLGDSGVETSLIEVSPTAPTSSTFVLNVAGEDRRFVHCVGANGEFDGHEITAEQIREVKAIFIGGFCLMDSLKPEQAIRLFRLAREHNVKTFLNVVLSENTDTMAWLTGVLPWTDYFFCNNDEARRITGELGAVKQVEALRDLGAGTAIVTHGEHGAVLAGEGKLIRSGVYPVTPVDATGTGDAFTAGFLYGVLRGAPEEECLKFGSAMGASCVRSVGATTGVFNARELAEFVSKTRLDIENLNE
ncbi:carbohydrate kinase family protein [Schlesneria sp. DSM 10557]|uniref:carbohydrate kinase family protein n=1 Tax=Schlesneria sp. DSM 10557 TaxID=3044399 RepID=UPI0035A0B20A